MSEWRVAFAGESPADPLEWRIVSSNGDIRGRGEGGLDAFARLSADRTAIVIPGMQVVCLSAPLAARSERQAQAAAKFAIEDDVAGDVDHLHVALLNSGAESQTGMRTLFAMDDGLLTAWLDACSEFGIKPHRLLPDYMGLNGSDGLMDVAFNRDRAILRAGQWGASIDHALGADVLDAIIDAKAQGRVVSLAGSSGAANWTSRHLDARAAEADALDVMARRVETAPINLLQGVYATRQESNGFNAARWGSALGLAAAGMVAMIGANLFEAARLNGAAEALRKDTVAQFQQAFPEVERVVNPRAQLRALSAEGAAGEPEFLVLSSFLAAGLQSADGVSIDSVRFDAARQEVSASVLFRSYESLSTFRDAIEAAGGVVEEGGSRQVGDQRSGELTVRRSL
ncbi:MAG: type II secretion system protein GspL [Pseudomonadota bacterium]